MCEPVTLTLISLAAAGASAGAAIHQGEVQKNYADYQAAQAEADAKAAAGAAQVEAERIRKQGKAQRAQAVAALAGSGVDVGSGTAVKIDQTIDKNAEQDAYLTMVGGSDQAARLNASATGYRQQGAQAMASGYINAGTTLLSASTNNGRGWKKVASANRG